MNLADAIHAHYAAQAAAVKATTTARTTHRPAPLEEAVRAALAQRTAARSTPNTTR